MEPAVSTVLAEAFSQPTAWGDFEDWRILPVFKANRKTVSQAGGVPHSRRNLWLTQALVSLILVDRTLSFLELPRYYYFQPLAP